jgi:addiction module RelE/StbE family toxin
MARKRKLLWTGPALEDLRDARDYVSRENPSSARELAERIRKRVMDLRAHPHSGRIVPELAPRGYREVLVPPYRIVYEVVKDRVVVLRVWHGRRDLSMESVEGP